MNVELERDLSDPINSDKELATRSTKTKSPIETTLHHRAALRGVNFEMEVLQEHREEDLDVIISKESTSVEKDRQTQNRTYEARHQSYQCTY